MIKELWNLKKRYREYLIPKELAKEEGTERDRCSYTWENLYIKYYQNREFWRGTNFEGYKNEEKYLGTQKEKYTIFYDKSKVRFSGDVLFSFKSKEDEARGKGKKFEHYETLLKSETEFSEKEREYYLELLVFCNKMNYTLHNFGLMPIDGNLQKFKENMCDWDRMDRFVYFVAEYFNGNDQLVLTSNYRDEEKRKKKVAECKQKVFSVFDDVAKYCKEMYLITDDEYVKELVEFGKQKIERGRDVVRYMELAIKYWVMKDRIFMLEKQ